MLYLLVLLFIGWVFADRATRLSRVEIISLKTRQELFRLRDELRNAAIAREVIYNNWLEYMDTTLTTTIQRLDAVNAWGAIIVSWRHKNDHELAALVRHRNEAFRLPENAKICEIHWKYRQCLYRFLKGRHPKVTALLKIVGKAFKALPTKKDEIVLAFSTAPETSTLMQYGSSDVVCIREPEKMMSLQV